MAQPSSAFLRQRIHPIFGFPLPAFDQIVTTYVGGGAADSDDISTCVFKCGGVTVATLTYLYAGVTNNATSATLTIP